MLVRMRVLLSLTLLIVCLPIAADKKKTVLPRYVLSARTALVLVDPDAGASMTAPLANNTAREDVEKALTKWGRLSPVMDTQTADLVIVVRKGNERMVQPTVGGLPTNNPPVIVQPTDNGGRVGGQRGRPSDGTQGPPQDTYPRPQMEVGPAEDMFVVYEGRVDAPLQRPAVWRYLAKGALRSPNVPAVAEFRKTIEEAEKGQKRKP